MIRCCFDVDGVVLDFESHYLWAIKDYFSLEVPEDYKPECFYFSDILSDEQMQEGWDYFIASEHFGTLPSLVSSQQFNAVFRAYPVHFITNIPPLHLEVRRKNLQTAGFQFDSLHCGGMISFDEHPAHTKSDVIQDLLQDGETLVFLDDSPENCVNVLEHFPEAKVFLMSRLFNQKFQHSTIKRLHHWNEVFHAVESLNQTLSSVSQR